MAEYIKREDAIDILNEFIEEAGNRGDTEVEGTCMMARNEIIDLPSIGIKTGKWEITSAYPHIVYCSECHKRYAQTNWAVWDDKDYPLPKNYCPNCGAKMEGWDE